MYLVQILEPAIQELQEAFDWYEEQSLGLGYNLVDEIDDCLNKVASNPNQFVVRFAKKYHFATLKIFPYQIIYRVDENKKMIYVNAIFHTSRRPKKYKK